MPYTRFCNCLLDCDLHILNFAILYFNSNNFSVPPKQLAACQVKQRDELLIPFIDLPQEIDIREAQKNDDQIRKLRNRLAIGTATVTEEEKFLEIEGFMYYLSDGDSESPRLRLACSLRCSRESLHLDL